MIFELVDISILELLNFILWGSAITIGLISALEILNVGRKKEFINEKLFIYGFTCIIIITFLLPQIIFRIIGILNIFNLANLVLFNALYRVAYFLQGLGVGLLLFSFETIVKRTKYLISITMVIILIIVGTFPMVLVHFFSNSIFLGLYMIFFFLMTLLVTKFSSQEFRPISSFLLFVSVLILTSMLIGPITGPILYIVGHLTVLIPFKINHLLFAHSKYFWNGFVISSIIFSCGYAIYLFYVNYIPHLIAYLFIIIFLIYSYFYIKKIMKTEQREGKGDIPDILRVFAKPERITEEEVTISKEKKTCLVCKGKLTRAMYICPVCNTFYCEKCSNTLISIENACWVCETPFDDSKPTTLPKEDEIDKKNVLKSSNLKKN